MAAGSNQGDIGKCRLLLFQKRGEEMADNMIDPHIGEAFHRGYGLGKGKTDEQRANQTRALGDGQTVQIVQADACQAQGRFYHRIDVFQMLPGGKLRNHAAVWAVYGHLGVDDIAQQSIAIAENRRGCFVAGAFNAEDEHARFSQGEPLKQNLLFFMQERHEELQGSG